MINLIFKISVNQIDTCLNADHCYLTFYSGISFVDSFNGLKIPWEVYKLEDELKCDI